MRIYRIEDKNGLGPYAGGAMSRAEYGYEPKRHPSPVDDGINYSHDIYAGFPSLTKCYYWFVDTWIRQYLRQHGYKIGVYECPGHYVQHGQRQVAFVKAMAMKVEEMEIEDVHPS